MPIVDIQLVCPHGTDVPPVPAQALADALGRVWGSPPGRTWVRVQQLSSASYAENGAPVDDAGLPVFVTVLHAHPPQGEALATEALGVSMAVAECLGRPIERVHVQYAPPGAGRQAFGGRLVG